MGNFLASKNVDHRIEISGCDSNFQHLLGNRAQILGLTLLPDINLSASFCATNKRTAFATVENTQQIRQIRR